MKITHVMWNAIYGGAETMLVDIVNKQSERHEITLIVINDLIDQELLDSISSQVKIVLIKRKLKSKNPLPVLALNYYILTSKSDIIHFHQDDIIRHLPIRKLKKNLCLTVHSVEMDAEDVKKYNCLFAISPAVQSRVIERCKVKPILVVNGINVNRFVQRGKEKDKNYLFNIVLIGRLTPLKGHSLLLEAARKLIDKHRFNKFHIDFIGDGDIKNDLLSKIADLGLDEHINLLGTRSKKYIQNHLHEYDLLVQPSLWEGFGLVAVEGMAAKIPVLVSNIDGLKDVARNGEMAFMFQSENIDDLVEKICQILNMDVSEKKKKCDRAWKYAMNEYDVSRTSQDYLDCYESFLKKVSIS